MSQSTAHVKFSFGIVELVRELGISIPTHQDVLDLRKRLLTEMERTRGLVIVTDGALLIDPDDEPEMIQLPWFDHEKQAWFLRKAPMIETSRLRQVA